MTSVVPDARNPGPHPDPHAPSWTPPPRACDAHCHVFGPVTRFPYATDRTFTPPEAPLADLQARHRLLGLDRAVIVQSAVHGTDHAALLAALDGGAGRYRGVALIRPDTAPAEVARLHDAGVRGARLHFTPHLGAAPSPADIAAIVRLVAPHGWHLALHVAGDGIAEHADLVRSLPLRVVVDHLARVDLSAGPDSAAVTALRHLLDTGDVWVKTSGADRLAGSPDGLPDAADLAALLVRSAPERVVWGTDFPHPNTAGYVPDDGDLVDLVERIAPDPADRHRLLVDNPTTCFDFP
ncbi:2-pyrone-4,6-dicarboxylate hydrolase [Actinomycetospora sp. NBRC 106375]|uniref:amidohydrolase family protein n=1 Tax=Actinomycetospora sp. NBRC 106375 TaxID=3032207 RepID=UPI0024A4823D|nr:amidohydrolase family protein [Actinomycetospora sp. NBRC 106375]GLZ47312.1 2-pyrone-4,6-dicarboxylate hydrolase [Actinomycetospora sp. NBRC 106375]